MTEKEIIDLADDILQEFTGCYNKEDLDYLVEMLRKKIPEGAVVLTKEEYDGKEIVVEMSGGHKLRLTVSKFGEMGEIIEEYTRKETAERDFNTIIKALETKKASIMTHYGVKESVGADIAIRTVKELAKQFGCEIKEEL